jgi:hypothetical protein
MKLHSSHEAFVCASVHTPQALNTFKSYFVVHVSVMFRYTTQTGLDGASLEPTPAPTVAPNGEATGSPVGHGGTDAPSAFAHETKAPTAADATVAPSGSDAVTIAPVASPTAAPIAGGTASPAATRNGGQFETSSPTAPATASPSFAGDAVDALDVLLADGNNDTAIANTGNVTAQRQSLAGLPTSSTNLGLVTTKQLQPYWQIQTGTGKIYYMYIRDTYTLQ